MSTGSTWQGARSTEHGAGGREHRARGMGHGAQGKAGRLVKIAIRNPQIAYSVTLSVYLPFENQGSSSADMNIMLNNEPLATEGESITVARLLELKKYTFRLRIVKINGRLISRDSYDDEVVRDGDNVQVIYLMSGG